MRCFYTFQQPASPVCCSAKAYILPVFFVTISYLFIMAYRYLSSRGTKFAKLNLTKSVETLMLVSFLVLCHGQLKPLYRWLIVFTVEMVIFNCYRTDQSSMQSIQAWFSHLKNTEKVVSKRLSILQPESHACCSVVTISLLIYGKECVRFFDRRSNGVVNTSRLISY